MLYGSYRLGNAQCQNRPKTKHTSYYNAGGHNWGSCFSLPTVLCTQLVPNKYLPARAGSALRPWERTELTLSSTGTTPPPRPGQVHSLLPLHVRPV